MLYFYKQLYDEQETKLVHSANKFKYLTLLNNTSS